MIKGSHQDKDITTINDYKHKPNKGGPQYVRKMLASMKGEINSDTVIVKDFNTPHIPMNRSTKQKISKGMQALNDAMN